MSTEAYPLEVTVTEARQLLDTKAALLVDVREPFEIEICRVEDAELIPLRQIPEHVRTLPKDKHLLMLCHHGRRSLSATEFLRANGYTAVSSIAGGIDAWAEQIDPTMARY
jgi:adenylyltransferase/sulfurtransferase